MTFHLLSIKGESTSDIRSRLNDMLNGFPVENEDVHPLALCIVYTDNEDLALKIEKAKVLLAEEGTINDSQGIYFDPSPDRDDTIDTEVLPEELQSGQAPPFKSEKNAHLMAQLVSQGFSIGHVPNKDWETCLPTDFSKYDLGKNSSQAPPFTAKDFSLNIPETNTESFLKEYVKGNRDVLLSYFELQKKSLEEITDKNGNSSYIHLLDRLLGDNQKLIQDFMAVQHAAIGMSAPNMYSVSHPSDTPVPFNTGSIEPDSESRRVGRNFPNPKNLNKSMPSIDEIENIIKNEINQLTGFPIESIHRDSDFEEDLGLDSITVIHILIQMSETYPEVEQLEDQLRTARTIGEMLDLVASIRTEEKKSEESNIKKKRERISLPPVNEAPKKPEAVLRYVTTEEDVPDLAALTETMVIPEKMILIGRKSLLYHHMENGLMKMGMPFISMIYSDKKWVIETPDSHLTIGFEDLAGLKQFFERHLSGDDFPETVFIADDHKNCFDTGDYREWEDQVGYAAAGLFMIAKAIVSQKPEKELKGNLFSVLTGRQARVNPAWQAATGVAKAIAKEWPGVNIRCAQIEAPFGRISVDRVLRHLYAVSGQHQLIIGPESTRSIIFKPEPIISGRSSDNGFTFKKDPVFLLTGGGSGITAEMGIALAEHHRCTIIALGRTPWPEDLSLLQIEEDDILKKKIFESLKNEIVSEDRMQKITPKDINRVFNRVKRQKSLLKTKERLHQLGSHFEYYPVDVTRKSEITDVIHRIHRKSGPISGLIHGAGLTHDFLVSGKSVESFRTVFHAKVHSIFHLYHLLKDDPLEFVTLVSSISAVYGRPAQTDYVAANEVLNAVSSYWNDRVDYPVKAMLWSLWEGTGLANETVQMANRLLGLSGIKSEQGRQLFYDEVSKGNKSANMVAFSSESSLNHAKDADLSLYSDIIETFFNGSA